MLLQHLAFVEDSCIIFFVYFLLYMAFGELNMIGENVRSRFFVVHVACLYSIHYTAAQVFCHSIRHLFARRFHLSQFSGQIATQLIEEEKKHTHVACFVVNLIECITGGA